jgi:Baseplate J-like protein
MDAPPIDPRGYADVVAQTEALAARLSGWRPPPGAAVDPGRALIALFGRYAEIVIDRLNRAPEKNYLAFLNLIGTAMLPPQPARVPLTFTLAANSGADATVPAGTQVAADPREGETEDVVFSTEQDLVVTRTALAAVYTSDTTSDSYADRTAAATGAVDEPFEVFGGDTEIPHVLYLGSDAFAATSVQLTLSTSDTWQFANWPWSWDCVDGDGWAVLAPSRPAPATWRFDLPPDRKPVEVDGVTAHWLRLRLRLPLPAGGHDRPLDALAVGARAPVDPDYPVAPFGDDGAAARFYLCAEESFASGGARVTLRVRMARTVWAAATLTWFYADGARWSPLAPFDLTDTTSGLTRDGTVSFHVPMTWPRTLYRGRYGRWLRVDSETAFGTAPVLAGLRVDVDWELPTLTGITVQADGVTSAPAAVLTYNDFRYTAVTGTAPFRPFTPSADSEPAVYFGLDQPFANRPVALYLLLEPPRPEEVSADALAASELSAPARIAWEYSRPDGWRPLSAVDETAGFAGRGLVRFVGPPDLAATDHFGQRRPWLRACWRSGDLPVPPRLRRVALNTMWAAQVATVDGEILGAGNGNPGQRFRTAQTPLQPGQVVLVREPTRPPAAEVAALVGVEGADTVAEIDGEIWVRWHAVPDLYGSGPHDRHYTVDPLSGEVAFGDGSTGLPPPPGQNNVRITYRTGGGEQGNRPRGTVTALRAGLPYVESVTNVEPAAGGAPREPVERLKERGPRGLRHRGRAITADDIADLVAESGSEVARVAVIGPDFNPLRLWLDPDAPVPTDAHAAVAAGDVGVILVPVALEAADTRPTPSLRLLRQVREFLTDRCPPAMRLWTAGPEWVAVAVTATVAPASLAAADRVGGRVQDTLARYLHPLTGGPRGDGWAFGRKPHRSELLTLVERVDGVDHVDELSITLDPLTGDPELRQDLAALLAVPLGGPVPKPDREPDLRRWLGRSLVCPGTPEITVALD